jgi:hypothetical protein
MENNDFDEEVDGEDLRQKSSTWKPIY